MKDLIIVTLELTFIVVGAMWVIGHAVSTQPEKPCSYYADSRQINVPARCFDNFKESQ